MCKSGFFTKTTDRIEAGDTKLARNRKIIEAVVKTVSGEDKLSTLRLDECFGKWRDLYSPYSELSENTRKFYETVFKRFTSWCADKGIEFIEHVDRGPPCHIQNAYGIAGLAGKPITST